jgi:uncharacterized protein with PIN domain
MVLDTSALLAILLVQPESEDIRTAIEDDAARVEGASSTCCSAREAIEVVAIDREQARHARLAYQRRFSELVLLSPFANHSGKPVR